MIEEPQNEKALSGHLADAPQAALAYCVIERHLLAAHEAAEAERG